MSYILDALRRADSERERGGVPGIHAQPEPLLSPAQTSEPKRLPWPWIAAGAAATVAVLLAGYLLGRETPREEVSAAAPIAPAPAPRIADSPSSSAPRALPADERTTRSSHTAVAEGTATRAPRASAAEETAPRASTAERAPTGAPGASAAAGVPTPGPGAMPSAETAPPPTAAREAAPEHAAGPVTSTVPMSPSGAANDVTQPRIHLPSELPDHIRNELPAVTIGGSIYSSNPASRSLIVNGRVLREKDRVSSDLTLEEIRLKTAVLKYKGYLYEIAY
jgi:general secretion pathway protein B